jgi:hypothetical protein
MPLLHRRAGEVIANLLLHRADLRKRLLEHFLLDVT